jgi:NADH dehydrogenase FAD-containing subunit
MQHAAVAAGLLPASLFTRAQTKARVVVIGAGFGGATAARYLKRFWPELDVTVIEPLPELVMCPMSNRVIHGGMSLRDITHPYSRFIERAGLNWVKGTADAIDFDRREVQVGRERIVYDRLVVSPGVDFMYEGIAGLETAEAQARVPHAWKAGEQTTMLRNQLQALPEQGVVAMTIPKVPYRCPPGPYERASLIAYYLKSYKPKAKLLVFDANPEIQAKKGLFEQVWHSRYAGLLEYVPNADLKQVDAKGHTLDFEVQGKVTAQVLNVIPPQRAGRLAQRSGLVTVNQRWCGVNFLSYESLAHKGVHVVGDSVASSPGMPKSAHMANQQAKVCAAAVVASLRGWELPSDPIIANTCYSFVSQNEVIHVASVHRFDPATRQMVVVKGAGGLSEAPTLAESLSAMAWAANILTDTLG